jgi:hypothetical protein
MIRSSRILVVKWLCMCRRARVEAYQLQTMVEYYLAGVA